MTMNSSVEAVHPPKPPNQMLSAQPDSGVVVKVHNFNQALTTIILQSQPQLQSHLTPPTTTLHVLLTNNKT